MFFYRFRKIISGCLIGLGIGILLILFLPVKVWLIIIGIAFVICGIKFLLGD
jgi:Na+-transporting NADH:ubiquinone oxidoreductase subunit NqrB